MVPKVSEVQAKGATLLEPGSGGDAKISHHVASPNDGKRVWADAAFNSMRFLHTTDLPAMLSLLLLLECLLSSLPAGTAGSLQHLRALRLTLWELLDKPRPLSLSNMG